MSDQPMVDIEQRLNALVGLGHLSSNVREIGVKVIAGPLCVGLESTSTWFTTTA